MKIVQGNLFNLAKDLDIICVTTNGVVKSDRTLVMGAGIALEFNKRFVGLTAKLGTLVKEHGNKVHLAGMWNDKSSNKSYLVYSFPTKERWKEKSSLALIEKSCKELAELTKDLSCNIYVPAPGCSNGGLTLKQVQPILEKYFSDDKFIITYL